MNPLENRIKKLLGDVDHDTLIETLKTCYELTESAVPARISQFMKKPAEKPAYDEIYANVRRQAIWYGSNSVDAVVGDDDWARHSERKKREFYTKILTVLGGKLCCS